MQPLSICTTNTAEPDRSFRQKTTHFLSKAERVFQYVLQHKTDPFLMVPIALSVLPMLSIVPILNAPIGLMTIAETNVRTAYVLCGLSIAGSCTSLHSNYELSQFLAKVEPKREMSTVEKVKHLSLMVSSQFLDIKFSTSYCIMLGCGFPLIGLVALPCSVSLLNILFAHAIMNIGVGLLSYGTRVAAERAHRVFELRELMKKRDDFKKLCQKNDEPGGAYSILNITPGSDNPRSLDLEELYSLKGAVTKFKLAMLANHEDPLFDSSWRS